MKLDILHNAEPISLTVDRDGDAWRIVLPNGSERRITVRREPDGTLHVHEGDRVIRAAVARIGAETHVSYRGELHVFEPSVVEGGGAPSRTASGELTAPMSGVVADVLVAEGDRVTAYQPVAVVEAMKVMATVEAPFDGRVSEVRVAKGQRVAQGETLVIVTAEEQADE